MGYDSLIIGLNYLITGKQAALKVNAILNYLQKDDVFISTTEGIGRVGYRLMKMVIKIPNDHSCVLWVIYIEIPKRSDSTELTAGQERGREKGPAVLLATKGILSHRARIPQLAS